MEGTRRKKSWTLKIRTILTDGLSRTGNSGTPAAFTHTYGILYVPCRKEHIHPKRLPNLTLRNTLRDRPTVKLQCLVCRRPIVGWSLPLRRPVLRSLLYMAISGAGCVSHSDCRKCFVLAPGSCALSTSTHYRSAGLVPLHHALISYPLRFFFCQVDRADLWQSQGFHLPFCVSHLALTTRHPDRWHHPRNTQWCSHWIQLCPQKERFIALAGRAHSG